MFIGVVGVQELEGVMSVSGVIGVKGKGVIGAVPAPTVPRCSPPRPARSLGPGGLGLCIGVRGFLGVRGCASALRVYGMHRR